MNKSTMQQIAARFPQAIWMDDTEKQALIQAGYEIIRSGRVDEEALDILEQALNAAANEDKDKTCPLAQALGSVLSQMDAQAGDTLGALGDAIYELYDDTDEWLQSGDSDLLDALDNISAFAQSLSLNLSEHDQDRFADYYAYIQRLANNLTERVKSPQQKIAKAQKKAAPSERTKPQHMQAVSQQHRDILKSELFRFLQRCSDGEFLNERKALATSCVRMLKEDQLNREEQINLLEKLLILDRYNHIYTQAAISDLESRLNHEGCLNNHQATGIFVGDLQERLQALEEKVISATKKSNSKKGRFIRSLVLLALSGLALAWTLSDSGTAILQAANESSTYARTVILAAFAGCLSGGPGSFFLGFLASFAGMSASLFLTEAALDLMSVRVAGGIIAFMLLLLRNIRKWGPFKKRALKEELRSTAENLELSRLYIDELLEIISSHCSRCINQVEARSVEAYYHAAVKKVEQLIKKVE